MTDRCEKCGRPFAPVDGIPGMSQCFGTGHWQCAFAADAYRRGLREGVEMAKDRVGKEPCERHRAPPPFGTIEWDRGACFACEERLDWTDVDAELERRLK